MRIALKQEPVQIKTVQAGQPIGKASEHLTRRELEVFALVAAGATSKEAAEALCISKRTVDFHLANLYAKLKVNNRMSALHVCFELGICLADESNNVTPEGEHKQ